MKRTVTIFSGNEVARVYKDVEEFDEEYNEELGENILFIVRNGIRENILICCSGWSYSVD